MVVTMTTRERVTATMVMLTITMVMPVIWHVQLPSGDEKEESADDNVIVDKQLLRVIRSLDKASDQRMDKEERHRNHVEDLIKHQMSAVVQNNTLPNYFLSKPEEQTTSIYRQAVLVFVHHPRAAGSAIVSCLNQVATNRSLTTSPIMDSDERLLWENERNRITRQAIKGISSQSNLNNFAMHRGRFAFGICGDLTRKCSHFILLREPMSRAVSSYNYCRSAYTDEMCWVVNANKLTLREWILYQGSVLFRQLVFQPAWCHLVANTSTKTQKYGIKNTRHSKQQKWGDQPCWYKHKLIFEEIPIDMKQKLLEYVVNNLNRWFGVIGIYEELKSSLKMFEHVYGIPFTECMTLQHAEDNNAAIFDNKSNRNRKRWPVAEDYSHDNDPEYLKYDYEVQQTLEPDLTIYREALKLFKLQRQLIFNKITR